MAVQERIAQLVQSTNKGLLKKGKLGVKDSNKQKLSFDKSESQIQTKVPLNKTTEIKTYVQKETNSRGYNLRKNPSGKH